MSEHPSNPRRRFLKQTAVVSGAMAAGLPGILRAQSAPAILSGDWPLLEQGLQIGDVLSDRAIVWSRSDPSAPMIVEGSTSDSFTAPRRVVGPHALEVSVLADALVHAAGIRAHLPVSPLRQAARRVRARHAQLPRREQLQPPAGTRC